VTQLTVYETPWFMSCAMQQHGLWMMLRMDMDPIGKFGNIKVVIFLQQCHFGRYSVFYSMASLYLTFLCVLYRPMWESTVSMKNVSLLNLINAMFWAPWIWKVIFGMPSACVYGWCALLTPERLDRFYSYSIFKS
jgi:hypothetical protein